MPVGSLWGALEHHGIEMERIVFFKDSHKAIKQSTLGQRYGWWNVEHLILICWTRLAIQNCKIMCCQLTAPCMARLATYHIFLKFTQGPENGPHLDPRHESKMEYNHFDHSQQGWIFRSTPLHFHYPPYHSSLFAKCLVLTPNEDGTLEWGGKRNNMRYK